MLYIEYYRSALRHLDVCKTMMDYLDSMQGNTCLSGKRERLKLDIYYLSGYIIETMISYTFFVSLNWQKNVPIEKCQHYNKGFKTHKLSSKILFATSKVYCDYSGIPLLGNIIDDSTERKMFNSWSEVVRYQNPKTYSKLEFSEGDLRRYLSQIELMFKQLTNKYHI